jgi:hypothetical protein
MRKPECPQHPGGRVCRDGRYGKNGQYQRWRCIPPGGTRRDSHLFQPTPLPRKAVGGGCMECDRSWSPGDGLPSARTDRFSLREKAEALVQMAHVRRTARLHGALAGGLSSEVGRSPPTAESLATGLACTRRFSRPISCTTTRSTGAGQRCWFWTPRPSTGGPSALTADRSPRVVTSSPFSALSRSAPPPRRLVDMPELYPGLRGGRQRAPED